MLQRQSQEVTGQKSIKWTAIPGYEGYYEINLNGEVRSLDRYDGLGRFKKGKLMKLGTAEFGYKQVQLCKNGKCHNKQIHRLLKIIFDSPPPFKNAQVRHYDGNPLNNSLDNLLWGTAQDNKDDQVRHGRLNKGSEVHNSKLSEFEVKRLRELKSIGVTNAEISLIFNITQTTVCDILKGRSWDWL